jgi:hypothetical protein
MKKSCILHDKTICKTLSFDNTSDVFNAIHEQLGANQKNSKNQKKEANKYSMFYFSQNRNRFQKNQSHFMKKNL